MVRHLKEATRETALECSQQPPGVNLQRLEIQTKFTKSKPFNHKKDEAVTPSKRGSKSSPPHCPGIRETLSNLERIHLAPQMFFFFFFFSFSVAKVDVMEGLLRSSSSSSEKETKCQPHVCVCVCEPLFGCFL